MHGYHLGVFGSVTVIWMDVLSDGRCIGPCFSRYRVFEGGPEWALPGRAYGM
jgi:hypothetical protein